MAAPKEEVLWNRRVLMHLCIVRETMGAGEDLRMDEQDAFGAYLREERLRAGYSTHRLAELCGVGQSTVQRIESGFIKRPDPEKLQRIAAVLELDASDVLQDAYIDLAQKLLVESELTIADIAAQLGFSDQAHLTKAFRQVVGGTPAAWRRMQRIL